MAVRTASKLCISRSDRADHRKLSTDVDRYGRIVSICFKGNEDLNRWMVANGWAVAFRRYSLDYVASEAAARRSEINICRAFSFPNAAAQSVRPRSRPTRGRRLCMDRRPSHEWGVVARFAARSVSKLKEVREPLSRGEPWGLQNAAHTVPWGSKQEAAHWRPRDRLVSAEQFQ